MRKITIGLADDDPLICENLAALLKSLGYDAICEADDGMELIEHIEREILLPDVCITDVNMPGMDGSETVLEIKRKWPSVKILAYSMNDNKAVLDKCVTMALL